MARLEVTKRALADLSNFSSAQPFKLVADRIFLTFRCVVRACSTIEEICVKARWNSRDHFDDPRRLSALELHWVYIFKRSKIDP